MRMKRYQTWAEMMTTIAAINRARNQLMQRSMMSKTVLKRTSATLPNEILIPVVSINVGAGPVAVDRAGGCQQRFGRQPVIGPPP